MANTQNFVDYIGDIFGDIIADFIGGLTGEILVKFSQNGVRTLWALAQR